MIGSNTVFLNQATMKQIVQHYFKEIMFREGIKGLEVMSVKPASNSSPAYTYEFEVTLSDAENQK